MSRFVIHTNPPSNRFAVDIVQRNDEYDFSDDEPVTPPPRREQQLNRLRSLIPNLPFNIGTRFVPPAQSLLTSWGFRPRRLESVSEDDACTICYVYKRDAIFTPCEHNNTCWECSLKLSMNKATRLLTCPMCRKGVTAITAIPSPPNKRQKTGKENIPVYIVID